jgi:hypothetical protein
LIPKTCRERRSLYSTVNGIGGVLVVTPFTVALNVTV